MSTFSDNDINYIYKNITGSYKHIFRITPALKLQIMRRIRSCLKQCVASKNWHMHTLKCLCYAIIASTNIKLNYDIQLFEKAR